MQNRFFSDQPVIENGGMFSRQKIQQISKQVMNIYGNGTNRIQPASTARCMIDTYRGMNKHFIPTGFQLKSFAQVFDKDRNNYITEEDLIATASRLFLANNNTNRTQTAFR